jgi:hypothetical protein
MARRHVGNASSADVGQTRWCGGRGAEIDDGDILSNGTANKRKLESWVLAQLVCAAGVQATRPGSMPIETGCLTGNRVVSFSRVFLALDIGCRSNLCT